MTFKVAPELRTSDWLNTHHPITLAELRGKVVFIEVFQMLCPGCVSHGLPQAQKVAQTFSRDDVVVLGLHTVFEHHAAQGTREALAAFLHEYKLTFPVAIDAPSKNKAIPQTMELYQMRGTPTTIILDRHGQIRKHKFGREEDMIIGAEVMALLREPYLPEGQSLADSDPAKGCTDEGCPVPNP